MGLYFSEWQDATGGQTRKVVFYPGEIFRSGCNYRYKNGRWTGGDESLYVPSNETPRSLPI